MDTSKLLFYKKYICENVIDLNDSSISDIFKFIRYKVDETHIKQCYGGVRINLNQLDNDLIYGIFKQIEYKTQSENK
jgi:hypothetical protein